MSKIHLHKEFHMSSEAVAGSTTELYPTYNSQFWCYNMKLTSLMGSIGNT
jgi:hypothetical protein